MKPYSEFDESPVVTECPDCGEISAEDECPYCEWEREDTHFDARARRRDRAVGSDEWHIGDMEWNLGDMA